MHQLTCSARNTGKSACQNICWTYPKFIHSVGVSSNCSFPWRGGGGGLFSVVLGLLKGRQYRMYTVSSHMYMTLHIHAIQYCLGLQTDAADRSQLCPLTNTQLHVQVTHTAQYSPPISQVFPTGTFLPGAFLRKIPLPNGAWAQIYIHTQLHKPTQAHRV
jgi:hypothetical protein